MIRFPLIPDFSPHKSPFNGLRIPFDFRGARPWDLYRYLNEKLKSSCGLFVEELKILKKSLYY